MTEAGSSYIHTTRSVVRIVVGMPQWTAHARTTTSSVSETCVHSFPLIHLHMPATSNR